MRRFSTVLGIGDIGLWLAFFSIIYVVLLIKVLTGAYINHNLFFGFYSIIIVAYILSRFALSYLHKEVPVVPGWVLYPHDRHFKGFLSALLLLC